MDPLTVQVLDGALVATAAVEPGPRVQKQMIVRVDGSRAEIVHRIRNVGLLPAEFAAWVLTVMAPDGVAVSGFPPRGTHPEHLAPSNPLVMWRFTGPSDARWTFLRKYIVLRQDSKRPSPQKIGLFNPNAWGAYFLNPDLFVKSYRADPAARYPDYGPAAQAVSATKRRPIKPRRRAFLSPYVNVHHRVSESHSGIGIVVHFVRILIHRSWQSPCLISALV